MCECEVLHTYSKTSQPSTSPASSRSLIVRSPKRFSAVQRRFLMSLGHLNCQTHYGIGSKSCNSCCISAMSSSVKSTIANGDSPCAALISAAHFLRSSAIQFLVWIVFMRLGYKGTLASSMIHVASMHSAMIWPLPTLS